MPSCAKQSNVWTETSTTLIHIIIEMSISPTIYTFIIFCRIEFRREQSKNKNKARVNCNSTNEIGSEYYLDIVLVVVPVVWYIKIFFSSCEISHFISLFSTDNTQNILT